MAEEWAPSGTVNRLFPTGQKDFKMVTCSATQAGTATNQLWIQVNWALISTLLSENVGH